LFEEDAHKFLDSIDTTTLIGLRNKAIISVMLYTWGRVTEVRLLKRKNYFQHGKRHFIEFVDDAAKNNKGIVLPVGHRLQDALDEYIEASGISDGYLFRTSYKRSGKLLDEPLGRRGMLGMIKRCSGEFHGICCHSMRATGITSFLKNGGNKTRAQNMARHSNIGTTDLYDRNAEEPTLDDVNLILPRK
jgi:integrase